MAYLRVYEEACYAYCRKGFIRRQINRLIRKFFLSPKRLLLCARPAGKRGSSFVGPFKVENSEKTAPPRGLLDASYLTDQVRSG